MHTHTHTHTPISIVLRLVGVVARFGAECNGPSLTLGGEDAGLEVLETLSMG